MIILKIRQRLPLNIFKPIENKLSKQLKRIKRINTQYTPPNILKYHRLKCDHFSLALHLFLFKSYDWII